MFGEPTQDDYDLAIMMEKPISYKQELSKTKWINQKNNMNVEELLKRIEEK